MTLSRLPARCKQCRLRFTPEERAKAMVLHPDCVDAWLADHMPKLEKRRVQVAKKRAAEGRAVLREKLRTMRKLSEFRADAQKAFNAWVRSRDADLPCVSCGVTNPPMLPGGQWDAGHFLSRGAYPELALEEINVWKQCKPCNAGSGKFSHKARTVAEKYEEELLRRIGPERLAWLKGPHEPKKYTREDYEAIEATYKQKRKQLEELA